MRTIQKKKDDMPPVSVRDLALKKGKTQRIYCMGNLSLLDIPGVGFCGSRKASPAGIAVAEDCAFQIAKSGYSVISGYAAGVDMAAHKTALASGGTTIIVLPEGIDHFRIKREITECWDWNRILVISQFAPEQRWAAFRAMGRNLVIIALSRAMIVIEAGEKGGTFAAGLASLKEKCPLFVVDYGDNEYASGNRTLLQKGGYSLLKSAQTNRASLRKVFMCLRRDDFQQEQLSLL